MFDASLAVPFQWCGITVEPFIVRRADQIWVFFVIASLVALGMLLSVFILRHVSFWRKLPVWIILPFFVFRTVTTLFFDFKKMQLAFVEKIIISCAVGTVVLLAPLSIFLWIEQTSSKRRVHLLLRQQEIQLDYHRMLSNEQDTLRNFRKDVYNRVQELKASLQDGSTTSSEQLLHQLQFQIASTKPSFSSGNLSINALIQSKLPQIRSKGCKLELSFGLKPDSCIRDIDLVCVLANLLDNAIRTARPGETVFVSARMHSGMCVLTVKNPAHGDEVLPKDVSIQNIPRNGHGIGLVSVQKTVSQYDGQLSLYKEGGMIVARAIMLESP